MVVEEEEEEGEVEEERGRGRRRVVNSTANICIPIFNNRAALRSAGNYCARVNVLAHHAMPH